MAGNGKMKDSRQSRRQDGEFHSKNIKHDPQAESARAKLGLNTVSDGGRKGNG